MSSKRRRWFQFRLRTLLIVVLMLSLPLSWFGARLRKARRQRDAVVALLNKFGGHVEYAYVLDDDGFTIQSPEPVRLLGEDFVANVISVDLNCRKHVSDDDLRLLESLPELEYLTFYGGDRHFTDAGLAHLSDLRQLRYLDLSLSRVSDDGLQRLEGLTNLEWLLLNNTQVTDAGLEHLRGLASLERVQLHDTQVTAEGVKKLREALPDCYIECSDTVEDAPD